MHGVHEDHVAESEIDPETSVEYLVPEVWEDSDSVEANLDFTSEVEEGVSSSECGGGDASNLVTCGDKDKDMWHWEKKDCGVGNGWRH